MLNLIFTQPRKVRRKARMFFFEKKNQKTFVHCNFSNWRFHCYRTPIDKSFLLLFFKKEVLPCLPYDPPGATTNPAPRASYYGMHTHRRAAATRFAGVLALRVP
jgi:hypothetical protein